MGTLTPFLQSQFRRHAPAGWECASEVPLLSTELTQLLGYDPRADVVLSDPASRSRIWVEFEVSRADPVANHAKFATAHLYSPQTPADHFVSMVSPHIDRGRRNLAAATVRLMRRVGMSAFQTTLLPLATPAEVKRLNRLPADVLGGEGVDVVAEVGRALAVVTPVGQWGRFDVHLVGDLFDVFSNLRGWNDDLRTVDGRRAWGKRSCTYFVYDAASRLFAPSKFCAYVAIHPAADRNGISSEAHRMSVPVYTDLNDGTHVMDGHRAWKHLVRELGMRVVTDDGTVSSRFDEWLADYGDQLTIRGGKPTFLLPPSWYVSG